MSNKRVWNRIYKRTNDYLYDHYMLRETLINARYIIFALLSAVVFAFGFCAFVSPSDPNGITIVTGGASGLSQNIVLICEMFGISLGGNNLQAILYSVVNVPILLFAFFCVGRRFAIFSLVDVLLTSLFIKIFTDYHLVDAIAQSEYIANSILSRALFGGVTIGFSSAIAFKGGISSGGIDVLSYYFSVRKSTGVGKYSAIINGCIITLYSALTIHKHTDQWAIGFVSLFYALVYLLASVLVVDLINVRNKKVKLQIISSKPYLPEILLAFFPHGATIVHGKGAYSGKDNDVIFMVVSSNEVKKVVSVCKKADPHVFILVSNLIQVYGKFYIKPVE